MFQPSDSVPAFSFESVFTYNKPNYLKSQCTTAHKSVFTSAYRSIQVDEEDLSECKSKEMCVSKTLRAIIIYISYITVFLFSPISIWFCLKRIHALERLVIFRLGKLQPVVGPGFCLVLPIVDLWKRVDLNVRMSSLPAQQLLTADGAIVEFVAEIKYSVGHVVHYVTRLHSQEHSVKDLSLRCLTNLISGKEQSDLEKHKEMITSYAKMELNKTVIDWGVEILDVVILTVKIIKEAEPANPLNSILRVLKAANSGTSSEVEKNVISTVESKLPEIERLANSNDIHTPTLAKSGTDSVLQKIRSIAEEAANNMSLDNVSAICKFRIVDEPHQDTIIFLSFREGIPAVFEGENASLKPDVIIKLHTIVMNDLLNLKLSPLQAYVQGKIQIDGDFNLLNLFNTMFNK